MRFRAMLAMAGTSVALLSTQADVLRISEKIAVDGRLEEGVWAKAKWEGKFVIPHMRKWPDGRRTPTYATEFAVLADAGNVYVGIRCHHGEMPYVKGHKKTMMWGAEGVEIYFCPDGNPFSYYQFLVTYQGDECAAFWDECGAIRPDPYGPKWEHAIADTSDGYSVELRFPLSAFYMTRNAKWSDKWLMNVGRAARGDGLRTPGDPCEYSGWCDVDEQFGESSRFKSISGFPLRRLAEDVLISSALSVFKGVRDGKPVGDIQLRLTAAQTGDATVTSPYSQPLKVRLAAGENTIALPSVFPENARHSTRFAVEWTDGTVCERRYPLLVNYQPIYLTLTRPCFRGNFYPGQDSSRVTGSVRVVSGTAAEVTLEGPGFAKQTVKVGADGSFAFDTTGFQDGDAWLTVTAGGERHSKKIRKLAPLPPGRHMAWIENGNLVVDGRPTVRRNMYATGFLGGSAFDEKFRKTDMHITSNVLNLANLDLRYCGTPVIYSEALRDVKPSKCVFDWIDKQLAKSADRPGCMYYIMDEPECHGSSEIYFKHIYDYVAEKDPYHIIFCCSRAGDVYCDIADLFETHPYLNPHTDPNGKRIYSRDFNTIGGYIDAFKPDEHPDKCIGGTPTCFAYQDNDYPTFDEYVLNYWCEFVRGAKTMYPYAYLGLGDRPALFEGTRYMFESIECLEDVILFGKRRTLRKDKRCECALWTMPDGDKTFALLNFTAEPLAVTVDGLSGRFREFRGTRCFDCDASLAVTLQPHESLIACEKTRDAGVKTLAQVRAEIDAAEYARTHRGNQLFDRHGDMDIKTSTGKRGPWGDDPVKLFDGVLDMLAWQHDWSTNCFYDVGLAKVPVAFKEACVWGRGFKDFSLAVQKDGQWTDLVPGKVEKEGDLIRLTFADTCRNPERVKFKFPRGKIEVYELELPELKAAK